MLATTVAVQPAVNAFYDKNDPDYGGITVDLNNELLTAVQEAQAQGLRASQLGDELLEAIARFENPVEVFCPWYTVEALAFAGVRIHPQKLERLTSFYGCVPIAFGPGNE